MTRETITLTKKEQQRGQVLPRVHVGLLTAQVAAKLLELSVRHVRRLIAAVRKKGLAALAHGNRGQQSRRRCADAVRTRVLTLARTRYRGCNDCHFTELLAEREGIHLSRPTVQRLLREAGMGSPRTRRPPRHRRRRERMPQAGLLVQLDGSHHPWLRDAMAVDSLDECGVYFGTTGGQVYASADAGDTWAPIVRDLPAVLSVEVQTLP